MKFYLGTWLDAPPGEPVWMIYEVNEAKEICRRLEAFPDLTYTTVDFRLDSSPALIENSFDLEDIDLNDIKLALFEIREVDFERYWKIAAQEK